MTVFYRKYRPQKISDLDSKQIRKQISSVLSSDRIPQAFLLTGPRGLGKTSTARIIAKSVNCLQQQKDGEPCDKCEMCESITLGNNMDIMEMDGASNRGIDEIRDLRDKVRLAPVKAKYKVYIIDEAHMLTNEAFNALLKTLEEPPEHAIFILCTTIVEKLPETIISRCIRIDFSYPTKTEIIESLKRVIKGEGRDISVDEEAYEKLAQLAHGSFRDGQKILDQLSLEGKKITNKFIEDYFGGSRNSDVEFLELLIKKDIKKCLVWLNNFSRSGFSIKTLVENCLNFFHETLLLKTAGIKTEREQDIGILSAVSITDIEKLINLFSQVFIELKSTVIMELPLEMAVIEWCNSETKTSGTNSQSNSLAQKEINKSALPQVKEEHGEEKIITDSVEQTKTFIPADENLLALWPKILASVKPVNHSIEALLRSSRPLQHLEDCLTIEVFYPFHKERLEEPKILEILRKTVSDILNKNTKIKYVLGEKKKPEKIDIIKTAEEIFNE